MAPVSTVARLQLFDDLMATMNDALIPALIAAATSTAGLVVSAHIARSSGRRTERIERMKIAEMTRSERLRWTREVMAEDVAWIQRWLDRTSLKRGSGPDGTDELFGKLLTIQALGTEDLGNAASALRIAIALCIFDPTADDGEGGLIVRALSEGFGTPDVLERCTENFFRLARRDLGLQGS